MHELVFDILLLAIAFIFHFKDFPLNAAHNVKASLNLAQCQSRSNIDKAVHTHRRHEIENIFALLKIIRITAQIQTVGMTMTK